MYARIHATNLRHCEIVILKTLSLYTSEVAIVYFITYLESKQEPSNTYVTFHLLYFRVTAHKLQYACAVCDTFSDLHKMGKIHFKKSVSNTIE